MKESNDYIIQNILTSVKHIAILANACLGLFFLDYFASLVHKMWTFLF